MEWVTITTGEVAPSMLTSVGNMGVGGCWHLTGDDCWLEIPWLKWFLCSSVLVILEEWRSVQRLSLPSLEFCLFCDGFYFMIVYFWFMMTPLLFSTTTPRPDSVVNPALGSQVEALPTSVLLPPVTAQGAKGQRGHALAPDKRGIGLPIALSYP